MLMYNSVAGSEPVKLFFNMIYFYLHLYRHVSISTIKLVSLRVPYCE